MAYLPDCAAPNVAVVPFCVPLPSADGNLTESFGGMSLGNGASFGAGATGKGAVGTITFLGKSAMVWFGWGDLIEAPSEDGGDGADDGDLKVGRGLPLMGCTSLSTPRSTYSGALHDGDPPSAQIVGGLSEEDMVLGMQMSARLAKRTGWPVFVSCGLNASDLGMAGMEGMGVGAGGILGQRVAALAEREAGRILLERKKVMEGR